MRKLSRDVFSIICTIILTILFSFGSSFSAEQSQTVLPAKFPDFENYGRFLVSYDKNEKKIKISTNIGFFGTFVKYDDGNILNGISASGAHFVFKGTVQGFLGYNFKSNDNFPLTFQSEKSGLRYLCGQGKVTTPNGKIIQFTPESRKKWLSKLQKGNLLERRAAAQALGWIGSTKDQQFLLKALADKDFVVRGLAAESLMKIADKSVIPTLKNAIEEVNIIVKRLDEEIKYGNGQFFHSIDIVVEPFNSWYKARFSVSHSGIVRNDRKAKHNWLRETYEAAIEKIEHRSAK